MFLTFVAIALFFFNELIYDQFGQLTVNWMIEFYSVNYFAISLICVEQSLFNSVTFLRKFYTFMASVFFSFILIELSFINVPLAVYVRGLDDKIASNWALILGTVFIGFITYEAWHIHLKGFFTRLQGRS